MQPCRSGLGLKSSSTGNWSWTTRLGCWRRRLQKWKNFSTSIDNRRRVNNSIFKLFCFFLPLFHLLWFQHKKCHKFSFMTLSLISGQSPLPIPRAFSRFLSMPSPLILIMPQYNKATWESKGTGSLYNLLPYIFPLLSFPCISFTHSFFPYRP